MIMKNWMSGLRGAVLVVLLWVLWWALGIGGIMEALVDPDGRIGDIWPIMLALPGFIGGIIFSVLLVLGERGSSFDQVSLWRFALWGGAAGLILGLLTIPAEVGDVSPGAAGMSALGTVIGILAGVSTGVLFRFLGSRHQGKIAG